MKTSVKYVGLTVGP